MLSAVTLIDILSVADRLWLTAAADHLMCIVKCKQNRALCICLCCIATALLYTAHQSLYSSSKLYHGLYLLLCALRLLYALITDCLHCIHNADRPWSDLDIRANPRFLLWRIHARSYDSYKTQVWRVMGACASCPNSRMHQSAEGAECAGGVHCTTNVCVRT